MNAVAGKFAPPNDAEVTRLVREYPLAWVVALMRAISRRPCCRSGLSTMHRAAWRNCTVISRARMPRWR